jgi:hypothetical protein
MEKKTYNNHRTLTNSAKIFPVINGIKNLLDEKKTFEEYEVKSVTEWLKIIQTGIFDSKHNTEMDKCLCPYLMIFCYFGQRNHQKYKKSLIFLSILISKSTNRNFIIRKSCNIIINV